MDPKMESKIAYAPLDSTSNDFRLLRLSKRDGGVPSCELFHTTLDDKPEYEALSYTWGDAKLQGEIRVNGCVILVTQNLAYALLDIQLSNSGRALWVDALCIDQGNVHERNHQVQRMGRIYQDAKRVVAWLGRPKRTKGSSKSGGLSAFELIQPHFLGISDWMDIQEVNGIVEVVERSLNADNWSQWHELAALCELPYWSRLWIIQEIGLASDLIVYHGEDSINWRQFASVREILAIVVKKNFCPTSFLPLATIVLESTPARLEEQRAHRLPVWLKTLQEHLQFVFVLGDSVLTSAYILHQFLKFTRTMSYQAQDQLVYGTEFTSNAWGEALFFGSDEGILDFIANTGIPNFLELPTAQLEQVPDLWSLDPELTSIVRGLTLLLEHFGLSRHNQHAISDQEFLELVHTLRTKMRDKLPDLTFVHQISLLNEVRGSEPMLRKLIDMKDAIVQFEKRTALLSNLLQNIPTHLQKYREKKQPAFPLQNLLESCERSLCQEPKDKVYGLLSLASDIDEGEIVIDYAKPTFQLYMDLILLYGDTERVIEAAGSKDFELVRFSQLLQRSLGGPFETSEQDNDLLSTVKISASINGSILPLEAAWRIEKSCGAIEEERASLLQDYLQTSVHNSILSKMVSKTLHQLQAVDKDRIVSSISAQSKSQHVPGQLAKASLPHLNHLRLFSEVSGLIGVAGSNIREDDLLCLFPNCDIACIVRPAGDDYKFISRAVVAKRYEEVDKRVSSASPELFLHHVPEASQLKRMDQILLELDAFQLQELTCPASREGREYLFSTPQDLPGDEFTVTFGYSSDSGS